MLQSLFFGKYNLQKGRFYREGKHVLGRNSWGEMRTVLAQRSITCPRSIVEATGKVPRKEGRFQVRFECSGRFAPGTGGNTSRAIDRRSDENTAFSSLLSRTIFATQRRRLRFVSSHSAETILRDFSRVKRRCLGYNEGILRQNHSVLWSKKVLTQKAHHSYRTIRSVCRRGILPPQVLREHKRPGSTP